jgi:hypothetical protein
MSGPDPISLTFTRLLTELVAIVGGLGTVLLFVAVIR